MNTFRVDQMSRAQMSLLSTTLAPTTSMVQALYALVVVREIRRAMDGYKPLPLERSTARNEPCRSPRLDPRRSRARAHASASPGGHRAGLDCNARSTRACFGRELYRHMILQVLVSR